MKEFGYKNPMQVPKVDRVVLNVGMGEAIQNVKLLEGATSELGIITGQRPVVTKAKKAIAGFKLRQGMPIGAKVTLRSDRMYEFSIVCLRWLSREFEISRGFPKAFDGRGNYTLGLKEQLIFPEIQYDTSPRFTGWILRLSQRRRRMMKEKRSCRHMGMPFRT